MKNYKGYYIGEGCFQNKAEVDQFIRERNVRKLQQFVRLANSYNDPDMMMAASTEASKVAEYLVSHCGMTWEEVERAELAA